MGTLSTLLIYKRGNFVYDKWEYLKVAGLTVGGAASFSSDLVGDDDKVGGAGTGADAAGGVLNTPPPPPGDPNNTELLKNKKR